eukprot:2526413-Amphidinium_carterae.2
MSNTVVSGLKEALPQYASVLIACCTGAIQPASTYHGTVVVYFGTKPRPGDKQRSFELSRPNLLLQTA